MKVEDLGVGVIGCGWAGRNAAEQVSAVDRAHVIGIHDVDPKAAAALAAEHGVPAYASYEEMLDADDCGAVAIGSPQFAHKDQVLAAAAAGKHIFCEKPMALSVEDCDEMLAAAEQAGVVFCVGHVLRLLAPYAAAAKLVRTEDLGAPLGVAIARCNSTFAGRDVPGHWRSRQATSGGLLMEVSVHELDFMRHLCGEPEQVFAQSQTISDLPTDYPDLWHVQVRFRSGAIGLLRASRSDHVGASHFTIQCPRGTISNDNKERTLLVRKSDGADVPFPEEEMENGCLWEYRSWVEAIHDGTPMVVNARDGRQAVAMACAAMESAETGLAIIVTA